MKVRLQVRKHRTPEEERLWLLSKVNGRAHGGRKLWQFALWLSAFILVLILFAESRPALHFVGMNAMHRSMAASR